MPEPVNANFALLSALWSAVVGYLPGAAGAALSLKFLGDGLSLAQKATSFAVGMACAVYLAPAVIELAHVPGTQVQGAVEFLFGLFGLATVRELFVEINNADLIGSLKRRFLGGDK